MGEEENFLSKTIEIKIHMLTTGQWFKNLVCVWTSQLSIHDVNY